MGDVLEQVIGALNGVLGDYLARTGNGLHTRMALVHERELLLTMGAAPPNPRSGLSAERAALSKAHPAATPRLVVLVHGLMSTEIVWRMGDFEDYGARLARDLGYTPLYVRYNSGLHISENGDALDVLLERLVDAYPIPVEEITLLGHSMGGLVLRSAAHAAACRPDPPRRWLSLVKRAVYIGTPHLGAPLERAGNVLTWTLANLPSPYTRLIADIGNLRSVGIKDLRYANLRREDWEGADADALLQNRRHPVPLLPHIRHHLIAATLVGDPRLALFFGDALVPLSSAAGQAKPHHRSAVLPQDQVRIVPGMAHLTLAHHPEVYAVVRSFCEEAASA